jgi:hypothetical protein
MNKQKLIMACLFVITLAACKKDKSPEDTSNTNKTCTLSSYTNEAFGDLKTFQIEYAANGSISKLKSDFSINFNRIGDSCIISYMGLFRLGYIVYDQLNRPIEYCTKDVDDPESFSRVIYQYTGAAALPKQITVTSLLDSDTFGYTMKNMVYTGENLVSCDFVIEEDGIEQVYALNYEYNLSKKNTAINLYKQLIPLDYNAAGPFNITRYVSKNVPIKLVIPSNGFIGTFSYKWDQWGNMLEQAAIIDGDTIGSESYTYLCK